MPTIATEIQIAAPAARVWFILTDFATYPAWNPFILSISGPQEQGAKLAVTIQPTGGRAMSFKPRVLVFKEAAELRWKGQVLLPGIMDGEHYFQLSALGPQRTLLVQGETFTGLLSFIMRGSASAGTKQGFEAMNTALKRRAESAAKDQQV